MEQRLFERVHELGHTDRCHPEGPKLVELERLPDSPRFKTADVHPGTKHHKAIASLLAAGIPKNEILWEYICEDDSAGSGYSQQLLKMSRQSGYSNGATRLRPEDAFLGWQDYVDEAYEVTQKAATEARLYARPGFPSSAHAAMNYADTILIERVNEDVGSLPPQSHLAGAPRGSTMFSP